MDSKLRLRVRACELGQDRQEATGQIPLFSSSHNRDETFLKNCRRPQETDSAFMLSRYRSYFQYDSCSIESSFLDIVSAFL